MSDCLLWRSDLSCYYELLMIYLAFWTLSDDHTQGIGIRFSCLEVIRNPCIILWYPLTEVGEALPFDLMPHMRHECFNETYHAP